MNTKYKQAVQKINADIEAYKQDLKLANYNENQNDCYIHIDLTKGEIYQPYSNESLLNEEIFSFIENTYHFVKKNAQLHLKISFPSEMKDDEKQKIMKLIQIHYAVSFKEITIEIHRTNVRGTIILLIGALLFFIYGLLEWYQVNFIFRGIIEIFSWVFIWEACNQYVFTNTKNKVLRVKYFKLFNALV